MKLEPVRTHIVKYPDIYQVNVNRLLLACRPDRWKKSQAAALLLCALLAPQLTGCKDVSPSPDPDNTARKMNIAPIFEGYVQSEQNEPSATGISFRQQKADVVPLGNYPSMFSPLTEEAALVIIQEALQNHGLDSDISSKTVSAVNDSGKSKQWSFDLDISGANEPIYAEFLPAADHETKSELFERKALNLPEDPKEAAAELKNKLAEVHDESTGVIFYSANSLFLDPEQNLRNQVDEFVTWLKTSGLI